MQFNQMQMVVVVYRFCRTTDSGYVTFVIIKADSYGLSSLRVTAKASKVKFAVTWCHLCFNSEQAQVIFCALGNGMQHTGL